MIVEFNTSYVDKSEQFQRKLANGFRMIMWGLWSDAKRLAPVDTGHLRDTITLTRFDNFHYELRDGVEYGIMVEFGTKPHVIKAVNKRVLSNLNGSVKSRNATGGPVVFGTTVNHPGTNAQPFFRPAFDMAKVKISKLLE